MGGTFLDRTSHTGMARDLNTEGNLMKKLIATLALAGALLPTASQAATVTYSLPDILTFAGYTDWNTAATFSGNGFGGMYNFGGTDQRWAHLFGVELIDYSRTIMQVDISALAGSTIVSASLSFVLLDGMTGPQNVTLTGFDGGAGALTYQWDAPGANYGNVVASVAGGANSIDVTSLLAASVANGDAWFGMHLQGSSQYMWTWTWAGYGYDADRALVRLTVETASVPEPGTLALIGLALAGLAGALRRRH